MKIPLKFPVMIEARPVKDEPELRQILDLQRANLARNLSADETASQGFVTVEHDLEVLRRMHAIAPSIIATDGDRLAGYALVMPLECRSFIPVLEPMFERLGALGFLQRRFYVMGQICVGKPWRGQGVFDLLYRAHRRHLREAYDFVVTEVATRNNRSMRAHERIGFVTIERYRDATDEWALMSWDFRS
jgi:ribosomal protein S18 acetylase RimI-like enzyme